MKFYTNVSISKNKIFHRGYNNNERFMYLTNFSPTLGIIDELETGYKSLYDENIKLISFDSIKEYNHYKKDYSDSIEMHGTISPIYQFISEEYSQEHIDFDKSKIKIFIYDIEVLDICNKIKGFPLPEKAEVPIVSISVKDLSKNRIYAFGLNEFDYSFAKEKIQKIDLNCNLYYKQFKSEFDLLLSFVLFFQKVKPDVLIGFNNFQFDDPYLLHRIEKVLGSDYLKLLSPIKDVKYEFKKNQEGKTICHYNINGIQCLDYLLLYKKFIPSGRESYSLSFLSGYELGEDKVDYEEYENLLDFYLKDFSKFIAYNMYDVQLIDLMDKKLGLIDLVLTLAYMGKTNFEDVLSPIRLWDSIIFNYLKNQNILIPPDKISRREEYPGAYVHEPKPGIYEWVVSYDLTSLYPHEIMQYSISPESLIDVEVLKNRVKELEEEIENR